jgi:hypothetical protein
MHIYSSLCDDFGIFCSLATELPFPTNRETVLSFFEALQKEFPQLRHFYAREADEFALEQDKTEDTYASVTLELRRLSCGQHNPSSFSDVDTLVERVLELAPYYLNLSPLDLTAVDVLFGFDLVYNGNHDAVVLEASGCGTLDGRIAAHPGSESAELSTSPDPGPGRNLSPAMPFANRDPHHHLSGANRRISRRTDQRLFQHSPIPSWRTDQKPAGDLSPTP